MNILNKLTHQELNELYEQGSFFLLNHVPIGTQFSVDGSFWLTGPKFQGIKLIPPGFHIFTITPNVMSKQTNWMQEGTKNAPVELQDQQSMKIGYELRSGILRFFQPQEKVIRDYDPNTESYQSLNLEQTNSNPTASVTTEETITSLEYMKSIDSNLAPYPFEKYERWRSITDLITVEQVSKIIGMDSRGDAVLDSSMTNHISLSPHDPPVPLSTCSRPSKLNQTQWGKPRDSIQPPFPQPRTTFWPFIDLKRSWPKDALGPELTKWSRDKSWLLNQLMYDQFKGDINEFLGLLQLSFITFIEIQSIQSFEYYQILLNLITQSSLTELTLLNIPKTTTTTTTKQSILLRVERINYIEMRLKVIKVFIKQVNYLDSNFFSLAFDHFQIENWFFKILDRFRLDLNYIFNLYHQNNNVDQNQNNHNHHHHHENNIDQVGEKGEREGLLGLTMNEVDNWVKELDWSSVQSNCKRFDWNVKNLKSSVSQHNDEDDDDDEEDEEEEEEEEEEEFKPTVV